MGKKEEVDVPCSLCSAPIPWQETFDENGNRIYLCEECQEKVEARRRYKKHKTKKERTPKWWDRDYE